MKARLPPGRTTAIASLPTHTAARRHLELKGSVLPLSRTIGLYSVDARGQLLSLRDSPEHAVKLALPTLTLVAPPLLRSLGPWARQITG